MPSAAEGTVSSQGGPHHGAEATGKSQAPAWALAAVPGMLAVLVSVAVLVLSGEISARAAAYPRALAVLLLAIGLWCLLSDLAGLRSRLREGTDRPDSEYGALHVRRIAAFAVLIAVTVWLITPLGFFPAAAVLLVGGMLILGIRSPLRIAGYTVVVIALGYVLFVELLQVPLPLTQVF